MPMRWSVPLLPILLSACMFGGGDDGPAPSPVPIRERPSGPITLNGPTPRETQACFTDLAREDIRYSPLPDRDFGGGCVVTGAVQLLDIGVPVSGLKSMRCPLARTFTAWVRYAVAPAAKQVLGSELVKIESYGTYSCRGVIGRGQEGARKMSEHGLGNAVDVAAFILRDGRKITVEKGWHSEEPEIREFFETIHRSACKRFQTVLSPDYNAAHYNHMHLDMGKGPFCR
jgi:hypothetical protein